MGTQTQRACKLWSWWLPNAHDDRVKCYSRHRVPMSKLFGRFYCKVSGMMCCVRLRNPPVPSPYTVKETLRYANEYLKKKMLSQLSTLPIYENGTTHLLSETQNQVKYRNFWTTFSAQETCYRSGKCFRCRKSDRTDQKVNTQLLTYSNPMYLQVGCKCIH